MLIISGKSKCIDRSTSRERERERERERDVFFLNFVIFFNSGNSSTYYIINGICADGEQAKAFLFSEERTKV